MDEIRAKYKRNIRELRKMKGATKKEMALALGLSYEYVRLIEKDGDTGDPSLSVFKEIADYLGVELFELFI